MTLPAVDNTECHLVILTIFNHFVMVINTIPRHKLGAPYPRAIVSYELQTRMIFLSGMRKSVPGWGGAA